MRVLQLSVHFSPNVGGVETHLDDLVDGLVKRKIETMVLCYRPLSTKVDWQIWTRSRDLIILRLPWVPGLFYRLINSPLGEFVYLSIGIWFALPWVIILWRPQVIHAHGLVAGFVGVFWAKVFRVKTVISTHSLYHFPLVGLYRQLASWIFKQADEVICLSDQSVKEIQSLGVTRVKRFWYWVDQNRFKPADKTQAKQQLGLKSEWVILFIGRLIEIKGVRVLLAAAKKLSSKYQVVIAGDGELRSEVERAAKRSEGKVLFVGRVNSTQAARYYQAADAVVVPSTHDEGFGRVILEALSTGTPVIGANRGAIPEAMDKSVGRIIEVNEQNLVQAIISLTTSAKKLAKLGLSARQFATANYSSKNLEAIVRVYHQLSKAKP